jgi:hypothetical protein
MRALRLCWVLGLLLAAGRFAAAQAPPLATAQGMIEKVGKDTLTVRTREPDGKFGPTLVLRLTGTTKVTTLQLQMRAGKLVPTQKDTEAKDLAAKQAVAFVYVTLKEGPVLLAAVVQSPGEK